MTTEITFNKDHMTARDLKDCAATLEDILRQFDQQLTKLPDGGYDWTPEQADEFTSRVLQIRNNFTIR